MERAFESCCITFSTATVILVISVEYIVTKLAAAKMLNAF